MLKWLNEKAVPQLSAWSTIIANITIIAGLLIAYWTYDQSVQSSRIDKSLAYVSDFNKEDMLQARNTVYRAWKDFDFSTRAPDAPREVIDSIVEKVTNDHDRNGPEKSIKTAIINISTFFDSVSMCIEADVCDGRVLQDQLGPYAKSFYCLYSGWISRERKLYNLPEFGRGLIGLAEQQGAC